jgi:peptidoglycan/LPS O-acetylase OafA/YrhL
MACAGRGSKNDEGSAPFTRRDGAALRVLPAYWLTLAVYCAMLGVIPWEAFAFGEQGTYPLAGGEVLLETGDVVKTTCYYTNATTRNITFSESTSGEMCFNFALYYPKGALSCR